MEDVNPILNFYSSKLSNRFNILAQPLNEFSLNGFFYSLTTPDGGYFCINNSPDTGEVFFSNHLYIYNPFFCHPNNYFHNQAIISADFPYRPFHEAQQKVKNVSGFENFLCLYKKEKGLAHILQFSSSKENFPLSTIFMNNLSTLRVFADYFLKEWRPHFLKMNSYMINIAKDMGPLFKKSPILQMDCDRSQRQKFLKKTGIFNTANADLTQLTSSELKYIEYLLKGMTAKQIADCLCRSTRTVEHYLDNIKSKIGCSSKSELFKLLLNYKEHNLFPDYVKA